MKEVFIKESHVVEAMEQALEEMEAHIEELEERITAKRARFELKKIRIIEKQRPLYGENLSQMCSKIGSCPVCKLTLLAIKHRDHYGSNNSR